MDEKSLLDLPDLREVRVHDRDLQVLLERLDDSLRPPGSALDVDSVRSLVSAKKLLDVRVAAFG